MKIQSLPISVVGLIVLLVLLGLGGFVGGIPMLLDPSGTSIGLPGELLDNLPITTFILPGLFLIVVMGVIPFGITWGLGRHQPWARLAALAQGIVLFVWICFQIFLWGEPITIQYVYLIWGLVLIVLAWLSPTSRNLENNHTKE